MGCRGSRSIVVNSEKGGWLRTDFGFFTTNHKKNTKGSWGTRNWSRSHIFSFLEKIDQGHNRKDGAFKKEQPEVGPEGEPSGSERVKEHGEFDYDWGLQLGVGPTFCLVYDWFSPSIMHN